MGNIERQLQLVRRRKLVTLLRREATPNSALMRQIIFDAAPQACARIKVGLAPRLVNYIAAEAWLDATLCLVALEARHWTLRRLVRDGEQWHCALSEYPDVPIELDPGVEAAHADASLAILLALLDVLMREHENDRSDTRSRDAARVFGLCCENFS